MNSTYPRSDLVHENSHDRAYVADILVIGGSIAGCWAALSARRTGAHVILVEKGEVGTAGVVAQAGGSGYYTQPDQHDNNRKLVLSRHAAACGFDDLEQIERIYEESYRIGLDLKALGFLSNSGMPTMDGAPPSLLAFHGARAMLFMREALIKSGVSIMDFSPALELLAHDGGVAGAAGQNLRDGTSWTVQAGAVILATGGNAFLSGAMGTEGTTGEGHLMAAEAGAQLASMEFSGHYGISPKGSPTTKGFWYSSATFFDGQGRELPANGWESVADVAQAILQTGGAYASMNRAGPSLKAFARTVSSIYNHFEQIGIDPFTEKFPIELRYEGLIRSAGGLVVDRNSATTVAGLYAVGDATERIHLSGAAMSGGGPAIAWCLVSAKWAAEASTAYARARPRRTSHLQGLGQVGMRPSRIGVDAPTNEFLKGAQREILPIEKNVFRNLRGIEDSLIRLDTLWENANHRLTQGTHQGLATTRQAASLLAGARWIYRSAQARKETRGLHRLMDHPKTEISQRHRIVVSGLSDVRISFEELPLPESKS